MANSIAVIGARRRRRGNSSAPATPAQLVSAFNAAGSAQLITTFAAGTGHTLSSGRKATWAAATGSGTITSTLGPDYDSSINRMKYSGNTMVVNGVTGTNPLNGVSLVLMGNHVNGDNSCRCAIDEGATAAEAIRFEIGQTNVRMDCVLTGNLMNKETSWTWGGQSLLVMGTTGTNGGTVPAGTYGRLIQGRDSVAGQSLNPGLTSADRRFLIGSHAIDTLMATGNLGFVGIITGDHNPVQQALLHAYAVTYYGVAAETANKVLVHGNSIAYGAHATAPRPADYLRTNLPTWTVDSLATYGASSGDGAYNLGARHALLEALSLTNTGRTKIIVWDLEHINEVALFGPGTATNRTFAQCLTRLTNRWEAMMGCGSNVHVIAETMLPTTAIGNIDWDTYNALVVAYSPPAQYTSRFHMLDWRVVRPYADGGDVAKFDDGTHPTQTYTNAMMADVLTAINAI